MNTEKIKQEVLEEIKKCERDKLNELPQEVAIKIESGYLLGYADGSQKAISLAIQKTAKEIIEKISEIIENILTQVSEHMDSHEFEVKSCPFCENKDLVFQPNLINYILQSLKKELEINE